jgi:hypothetical protein
MTVYHIIIHKYLILKLIVCWLQRGFNIRYSSPIGEKTSNEPVTIQCTVRTRHARHSAAQPSPTGRHCLSGLCRAKRQRAPGTDTRQSTSPHVEWSPTHLYDISMPCALSLCHLSCLRRMAHRAARVHDLQDWILGGRVRLNEGRPCVNRNRAFRDDRLRHQAISALGPQPH